jgi:hypothetical protein
MNCELSGGHTGAGIRLYAYNLTGNKVSHLPRGACLPQGVTARYFRSMPRDLRYQPEPLADNPVFGELLVALALKDVAARLKRQHFIVRDIAQAADELRCGADLHPVAEADVVDHRAAKRGEIAVGAIEACLEDRHDVHVGLTLQAHHELAVIARPCAA